VQVTPVHCISFSNKVHKDRGKNQNQSKVNLKGKKMANFKILMFLLTALLISFISTAQADLNDGLMGYYPFNGNANDESGNNQNGIVKGATLQTDVFDNYESKSYYFDGKNDYIEIADNNILGITNSMTICAWAKSQFIIDKYDTSQSKLSFSFSTVAQNKIAFGIYSNMSNYYHIQTTYSNSELENDYYFVVGTWKNDELSIFINAEQQEVDNKSKGNFSNIQVNNVPIYFGIIKYNDGSVGFSNGYLDEIRIYNRVLSNEEISSLYRMVYINERNALIEFFNNTNGNSWNNNTFWLGESGTECTWFGIICDDSNYVRAIHLFNNNLDGTIPNSIKNLKHLQSLLLHGNNLTGSIPKEILQIETLESITLIDNNFSNNIITLMNQTIQDELNKPKKIDIKDAIYALQVVSGQYNIVNEPVITNSLGMTFKLISPGTFVMGSPEDELGHESDEKQYTVTISKPFYIQTTEVTQEQWESVMENNPSYFSSCGNNCPVENISWDDIQTFLSKLNAMGDGHYSLPTEAQWEYVARAGSSTSLPNGELIETGCAIDPQLTNIAWYCGNSESKTHPVAQKQPNAWGLYDIPGNVWEWCQDWYDNYPNSSVIDPVGPLSGSQRVIRDCGYDSNAVYCRSANRVRNYPDVKNKFFGLRLLKEL